MATQFNNVYDVGNIEVFMKHLFLATLLISLFPTHGLGQGKGIQGLVSEAIENHEKRLVIAPGVYRVEVPSGSQAHLTFEQAKDLTVIADGVRLICTKPMRAIELKGCTNLELSGLTVDYDPLPFTQGTVLSVDENDNGFVVKPHKGYPAFPNKEGELYLFDSEGQWKSGAWSGGRKVVYEPQGELLHVLLEQTSTRHSIAKGDKVVQKQKTTMPHVVMMTGSTSCTLRNVTLHTGPTFAVCDIEGDANKYLGVRITPGPKPEGATEPRLMANLADGIHCISAKRGPRIENCLIEGNSDDGIAIHGKYHLVLDAKGAGLKLAVSSSGAPFSTGDVVRLTSGTDGTIRGEAKVRSVKPIEGEASKPLEAIKLAMNLGNKNLYTSLRTYWDVELERESGLSQGDVVDCPSRSGSGFLILSNTIRNHRARGLLIKASDGLIEGNVIEHSSIAGIVVAPEISWWLEAGYSWNLVIKGNHLIDCGYEHPNSGHAQGGSISIVAAGMSKGLYAPVGGQRNIQVLSNTVERCRSLNLLLTSAQDILVQGNRFIRPLEESWPNSTVFGVPTNVLFYVENSKQVHFLDNDVIKPGPFMAEVYGKGPHAEFTIGSQTTKEGKSANGTALGSPWLATKDFGAQQGGRGWFYVAEDGKKEVPMKWNEAKKQWEGPENYCQIYAGAQHPGATFDAVRMWQAPVSGTFQVTGKVKASSTSDGVLLKIFSGTEVVWQKEITLENKEAYQTHDFELSLQAGQKLKFVVNRKDKNTADYTSWDPLITLKK